MNFLEIFGVKTQWIIGQKSQNRARYAGAFWGKITFFGRKVNKVPCIIVAIWGKINFLGIFGVKTHWIIGQKSQNSARYAGAFWGKNHFFGRKVNKVPCIIGTLWGKKTYIFEIFTNYHSMMVIFFRDTLCDQKYYKKLCLRESININSIWDFFKRRKKKKKLFCRNFFRSSCRA